MKLYLFQLKPFPKILIDLLTTCLLINLPLFLIAQSSDVGFQKVPIEVAGETFNTFYAITQDQEGYIWLGTNHGLLRYDGYEAKVYRHDPKDSTTIGGEAQMWDGSNPVYLLYVDNKGDVWAGTSNDLSRYSANCDCFTHYRFSHGKRINAIAEDKSKDLWIGAGDDGLLKYDRKSDRFIPYLHESKETISLKNDFVNKLLVDQHNNIWIGMWNSGKNTGGLTRFNPATGVTKRFLNHPNNLNSLSNNRIAALLEDKEGQIWVGTAQNGLHQYNAEKEEFIRISSNTVPPNHLQVPFSKEKKEADSWAVDILHQSQNGDYWAGTSVGLNHFDPLSSKLTFYNPSNVERAMVFFEDRQGQIWLGYSDSRGLFKMDTYARKFNANPDLPMAIDIWESSSESGFYWLGNGKDKGLFRFEAKTGAITNHFLHDKQADNSIREGHVLEVYEDQDQMLWIAIRDNDRIGGGLDRLNLQTGLFKHYDITRYDTSSFSYVIYDIAKDQEDYLWMNARKVIFRFDKSKETFKRYHFPETLEEDDGQIWLVQEYEKAFFGVCDYAKNILYQYNIEKDSFVNVLEGYKVTALLETEDGSFWIGTWAQGLLHLDLSNDSLEVYCRKDGLISDGVLGILPGEQGMYWLATEKGLTKFNSKTKKFTAHGLPKQPYLIGVAKGSDGQMLFGHETGVTTFYPDQVEGNPFPPDVVLSSLRIAGKSYDLKKAMAEKINLSYQQNNFDFAYKGIHNSDPSQNKYQYKLIPFDDDWIDAGFQRTARYTNLTPGDYTFQVKAASSDGVWSKKDTSFSFVIHPPWWQTWWAYTLFTLLTIGTIGWYVHSLKKRLQKEQSFNQQLSQANNQLQALNTANSRFVPNDFLQILQKDSLLDLKLGDQTEATMTILFVDIRDYTTLSEQISPEDNFKLINAFLGRMGPIIQKNGGFICQYMGDGMMALFKEKHELAINAAIEMQQTLQRYNKKRFVRNRQTLRMGIGLNTGKLMLGIIGDKNRHDSSVISDAVNTASRMEGLTKIFGGGVIVSEKTLAEIESTANVSDTLKVSDTLNAATYRFLGKVKVKGKNQTLKIYDFFDGDVPSIRQSKVETKADFEKAIHHYLNKEFGKAADLLKVTTKQFPEDIATEYYLAKAAKYVLQGVDEDWNGVEEMVNK